jgi:hypothetical protein
LSIALVTAGIAIALAACGAAGRSSSTGSASYSRALTFADCMRSHGVSSFPDPIPGKFSFPIVSGLTQAPGFRSAEQACKRLLPSPPPAPPVSAAMISRLRTGALAMARCLRVHGVPNFPDPSISLGPGGGVLLITFGGPIAGIDLASPAFRAAQKACGSPLGGALALVILRRRQRSS